MASSGMLALVSQRWHFTSNHPKPPFKHCAIVGDGCAGLELQFELIDQALAALGAWPEQLALHLGDQKLQVLDQGFGAGQPRARLDQCSFQRIVVVRKRISCRCHNAIRS